MRSGKRSGRQITVNCYQRAPRILNAVGAAWVLLAAISSGSALAQKDGEGSGAPAAPAASVGDAVFPSDIDPNYSAEAPAKARLHTCIDQYNRNKAANANGGVKWIEAGGGYYSACNKRLSGNSPDPALAGVGGEKPAAPAAPAATPTGPAVFPTMVDPKFAQERGRRARLRTCIDQFNKNKATDANGGLEWIGKAGGYYNACDKVLGGYPFGTAPLSLEGEEAEGSSIMARNAHYWVEVDETIDPYEYKCLYRNQDKLLCPRAEKIEFQKHYRTKDYDFLLISTGFFGSENRWYGWKLIVEDGKHALIEPIAEECLACDIRVEKLDFSSNEIVLTHRQAKELQTGTFRAGQFTLRKSKLDPQEPLDENTCSDLLGRYEECRNAERNTVGCSMAQANSGHFSLLRMEDQYAGISYEGMQQMCREACSGGKAMDNKAFMKKVCRR
ncbi:hypothetical protein ABH977_008376 [Bradyrhizobium ottawaense]